MLSKVPLTGRTLRRPTPVPTSPCRRCPSRPNGRCSSPALVWWVSSLAAGNRPRRCPPSPDSSPAFLRRRLRGRRRPDADWADTRRIRASAVPESCSKVAWLILALRSGMGLAAAFSPGLRGPRLPRALRLPAYAGQPDRFGNGPAARAIVGDHAPGHDQCFRDDSLDRHEHRLLRGSRHHSGLARSRTNGEV